MEIGSFFNLYPNGNPFAVRDHSAPHDVFMASGRQAIKHVVETLDCKKCLVPNYLCESVHGCFNNFDYYRIGSDFSIDVQYLHKIVSEEGRDYDLILITNFFGKVDTNISDVVSLCRDHDIIILEDFTHNLFSNELYGDVCIASFRKILPTPFGAILRSNTYKLGVKRIPSAEFVCVNLVKLLGTFLKNSTWLKWLWRPMLVYSENAMDSVEYAGDDFINRFFYNYYYDVDILRTRRNNIEHLESGLKKHNLMQDTYFCYTIECASEKERDALRAHMTKRNVYCPIYWPLDFDNRGECNHELNKKILSFPIDQRYDEIHMEYIVDCYNSFMKAPAGRAVVDGNDLIL